MSSQSSVMDISLHTQLVFPPPCKPRLFLQASTANGVAVAAANPSSIDGVSALPRRRSPREN
jgi:hypothetical protein